MISSSYMYHRSPSRTIWSHVCILCQTPHSNVMLKSIFHFLFCRYLNHVILFSTITILKQRDGLVLYQSFQTGMLFSGYVWNCPIAVADTLIHKPHLYPMRDKRSKNNSDQIRLNKNFFKRYSMIKFIVNNNIFI